MPAAGGAPAVSLVLPVYDEEGSLAEILSEIRLAMDHLGQPYEVIFVDDGSRDGSLGVLRGLAERDGHVRVLSFEKNAGQSAALDAGFRAARGATVVTLDADLQNDPADIPLLLRELDRYDVAVGWRWPRRDGAVKRVSSRAANAVRNWITGESIADTGCSLKAFRGEVVRRLKLFAGMHRFLPALCRMEGFSITQVRVNHRPRTHGRTKYGVVDRLLATVPDLLAIRWMQSRALKYKIRETIPR